MTKDKSDKSTALFKYNEKSRSYIFCGKNSPPLEKKCHLQHKRSWALPPRRTFEELLREDASFMPTSSKTILGIPLCFSEVDLSHLQQGSCILQMDKIIYPQEKKIKNPQT